MHLKGISLQHFKIYRAAKVVFSNGVNCFAGLNGCGKTSMLDAIYYLSFTKSFFNPVDQQCILHEEDFFTLDGSFSRRTIEEDVRMVIRKGEKKSVKVNNNEHRRLSDHIGLFPLVMITPNDIMLIHEGSGERRKFLDGMISQMDKTYLNHLLTYNRTLEQRNKQLRVFAEMNFFDRILLEAYNEQLVKSGKSILEKRIEFLHAFTPVFNHFYKEISASADEVGLQYLSDVGNTPYETLLNESTNNDQAAQRTTRGIHKDDLDFMLGPFPLRKFGSQGQQKSFIVALKLAQYEYLKTRTGVKPLLLLDDIFEKLDEQRLKKLLSMIANESFGQIFITDTHIARVKEVFDALPGVPVKYFAIEKGKISEL